MNLTYNGIKLEICHFETFRQRDLLSEDNADRIGTHYHIAVVCVWNPAATASFAGAPIQPVLGLPGDVPAVSLRTLRDLLLQPRQSLIVDIGGAVILQSPLTFLLNGAPTPASTDMANGPRPISCDVIGGFQGIQTAIVRFEIETTLAASTGSPSSLLANRWDSTEDIDETFRSSIHVEGQAVFRPDVLGLFGARPDAFRQSFLLPVPLGYQRTNLHVRASSDGTRVAYSFDDEQAEGGYQLLPQSPVVRVKGRGWYRTQWPVPDILKPVPLPVLDLGARVEVTGRQTTTRNQLANACIRALGSFPGLLGLAVRQPQKPLLFLNAYLSVEFPRRFAEAEVEFISNGLIGGAANILWGQSLAQIASTAQDFSAAGLWVWGGAPVALVGPSGLGTRSDAMIALVTQALLAPNTAPGLPGQSIYQW